MAHQLARPLRRLLSRLFPPTGVRRCRISVAVPQPPIIVPRVPRSPGPLLRSIEVDSQLVRPYILADGWDWEGRPQRADTPAVRIQ
jgi:hypothetical protein